MNDLDKAIICAVQAELPIAKEPYQVLANQLQIEESELLKRIENLLEKGIIRRMGAVLNHRTVGYQANAMVVWFVPEDQIESAGQQMALQPEISHCYQRPYHSYWPYNLYTMIHAKTKEECKALILKIADMINVHEYEVLYSTVELKKTSFRYFE